MDESFASHALVPGVRKHRLTNHGVSATKDYSPEVGMATGILGAVLGNGPVSRSAFADTNCS